MSTAPVRKIREGYGTAERPLAKDVLARDSCQDDPAVTEKGNYVPPSDKVEFGFERYYDRDYARREYDKILLKTWQLAAREEDIPNVGDRVRFDMGPGSFIIIHSGPNEYKAFFNSCRHRGSLLCTQKKEHGESIRCPVHGWEWQNNGELLKIPSWWDFPDVQRGKAGGLREARVARWGGNIFINADPDAPSLEEELGPIPAHFASFDMENRYTAMRLRKLIRANWKAGQEPFQEAYHVTETHTMHAAVIVGDTQTEYGIWKNGPRQVGVGRTITPSGVPSMNAPDGNTLVTAANIWLKGIAHFLYPQEVAPEVDPTKDTRKQMADWHRAMQLKYFNRDATKIPDTVMIDVGVYYLFPNTLLHLSEMLPYTFTFVPHPTDPEMCYMDLRVLFPCPVGKPRPPAAEPVELGPDDRVMEHLPQLDFQAVVLQQDIDNMERIQRGARAADPKTGSLRLGLYQEMVLRHWHMTYDEFMAR